MTASEILEYYGGGNEEQGLAASVGRLERVRTWEIIERHLPAAPSRVLDVGGGTGVYALPLARRGYQVPTRLLEKSRIVGTTGPNPPMCAEHTSPSHSPHFVTRPPLA